MNWERIFPVILGALSASCLLVDGGLPSDPTGPTGLTAASGASVSTTAETTADAGGSTMASPPTGGTSEPTSVGATSEASSASTTTMTTTGVTTNGQTAGTTTTTTVTSDGTTGGQTDPQPADGLYADCLQKMCNPNLTDGCWTLQDVNMMKLDGFCTLFCSGNADCMPKPNAPANTECRDFGDGQKVCVLSCSVQSDCPIGMTCTDVNVNGITETFCW